MEFTQFELPSGIRCIHKRVKSPVAYCGLTINTGSRDEKADEHGLAHLIEHCLFKGTERRRAYQINNRLENLGGELNAFTSKEETVVHATVLKGDFARAVELIADVVFYSVFPQKEIEREKDVILDEINSYKDSPVELIYDDFEDRLFAGSSLGHNILGTKRSVAKYTTDNIRAFCNRTYNTGQMVFSSVGNLSEKRFRDICERHLGPMAENKRIFERERVSDVPVFHDVLKKSSYQTHCILGTRAYANNDPKRIPLSLLVNILGGPSANSLLNMALRERNGLTYSVDAGYTPYSDTGIATIYFGTDRDKLDRCLELVDLELKKIISGHISSRQFAIAKKQFIGQFHISMESNEGNMLSAGKSCLVYNRVDPTSEVIRRIQAISLAELVDVAKDIYGKPLSSLVYQ